MKSYGDLRMTKNEIQKIQIEQNNPKLKKKQSPFSHKTVSGFPKKSQFFKKSPLSIVISRST